MITLLCVLAATSVPFACLSVAAPALWTYYVPVALGLVFAWLHVLDLRNGRVARKLVREFPDLLSADEQEMLLASPALFVPLFDPRILLAGRDLTPVPATVGLVALVSAGWAALTQAWVPLPLYLAIAAYAFAGPLANAFETGNYVDDQARGADRYLRHLRRRRRVEGEPVPPMESTARSRYAEIRRKLCAVSTFFDPEAPPSNGADEATGSNARSEVG
jgi:hypothetical protein